jgi:elongation factor P--beta-lysine ligase
MTLAYQERLVLRDRFHRAIREFFHQESFVEVSVVQVVNVRAQEAIFMMNL